VKKNNSNRYVKKQGGGSYAALAILAVILLAVGGYFIFGRAPQKPQQVQTQTWPVPVAPAQPVVEPPKPQMPPAQARTEYPAEAVHTPLTSVRRDTKKTGSGRLAIVIDDMGNSMAEARSLVNIGVPLTFAIIPGLRSCSEVAAFATANRIETMIHMPMQSKEWPKRRMESNGLLVAMSADEIRGQVLGYLRDIPGAVGANNHTGSEFTEHAEQMKQVLSVLRERKLFFVDSVTSPQSVGHRLAKEMGLKSARRNVFLDNEQDSAYIQGQLEQAVRVAKKGGAAIAICHPHPVTIKTLAALLPGLQKQGITLVPVSALVR
jgi:uncharacterized protein